MPKVLRIINRFNLGGPTYNAAYLTKYLDSDYETLLVGGFKDESEEKSDFIVRNLGIDPMIIPEMRRSINPLQDFKAYNIIKGIIRTYKPDIVHTHAAKAGTLGRWAAYSCNVPVIVHTFHGHVFHSYFNTYKSAIFKKIEQRLAKLSTQIVAISESQKYELSEKYKIAPAEKITVIPLGFDLAKFQASIEVKREKFRSDYLLDENELAVCIVGRLVPIKNHILFVDAIKQIATKINRPVRFFIVGDGESREQIENRLKELQLDFTDSTKEKRKALVTLTSWIKEVDYVYAGCDIVALTSLNEGTPVSLIEAQAANKPIVTTNAGGIGNTVIDGTTALISENRNMQKFAENLLAVINGDSLRQKLSAKGWEHVQAKYHYTRLVSDMQSLYNKLLVEKGKK